MVRHFGTLDPGKILLNRQSKEIAIVGEQNTLEYLHLQWLDGKDELINVNAKNRREQKYINRIKAYSVYSLKDFPISIKTELGTVLGKYKKVLTNEKEDGSCTAFFFLLARGVTIRNIPLDGLQGELEFQIQQSLTLEGFNFDQPIFKFKGHLLECLTRFRRK